MTPRPVPASVRDIDAEWLSGVLSRYFGHDVDVIDLRAERIGTGQAGSTYRLIPTYTEDTDLPQTLVAKLPAENDELRTGFDLGYRSELSFYRKMAHHLKALIPQCILVEISSEATDFELLLNDLEPMVQGNQITGCSATEARAAVEALAGLHGPTWCDQRWLELGDVAMPMPGDKDSAAMMGKVAAAATDIVLERIGSELAPEDHDTLRSAIPPSARG
ncbi:hypothetical protein HZU40_17505 [Mycolicibacterium fluoranthenivorans]|uniref:Uncharacterized protein n=1 Tax=Mycolicibacterium fluoranthenivorans TaxID=258505 RepID=A0A7G8P6X9_9MYCO|nr:hypothetical protein [Mycolicibacterium fluoranthenivorans]QNJ90095.1 hypothetical protein HZU40_17505 [Mycolicibacterium fluoranthenivorans]